MKHRDARKLSQKEQRELRHRAVRMLESGLSHQKTAEMLEVSRTTVTAWWGIYRREGLDGLDIKKRGRMLGDKRRLTPEQERHIQKLIVDKTPDQLKMPFALWTRKAIGLLIEQEYGVKLPVRTMGLYLKRWGFTPQKPIRKAYEQQPEAVKRWLDEEYPDVEKRAKREGATILWGDETGLSSSDHRGRGYAPMGCKPTRRGPGKRFSTSMVSTITNQGEMRFMVCEGGMNVDIFLRFLRRLIRGADRKIVLILDNLRVHHAKKVQAWVEKHAEAMELVFLPSYSPELNPDELLNQDVKQHMGSQTPTKGKEELQKKLRSYLRNLQRNPRKVANFFDGTFVQYAKAA